MEVSKIVCYPNWFIMNNILSSPSLARTIIWEDRSNVIQQLNYASLKAGQHRLSGTLAKILELLSEYWAREKQEHKFVLIKCDLLINLF